MENESILRDRNNWHICMCVCVFGERSPTVSNHVYACFLWRDGLSQLSAVLCGRI